MFSSHCIFKDYARKRKRAQMSFRHYFHHCRAGLDEFPRWYALYAGVVEGQDKSKATTLPSISEKFRDTDRRSSPTASSSKTFFKDSNPFFKLSVQLERKGLQDTGVLVPCVYFEQGPNEWKKEFTNVVIPAKPRPQINFIISKEEETTFFNRQYRIYTVSYTHLTLPTILRV